ncbi:MAG: hypothetical protein K1060chlam4_00040 [Candidatus Anoxychlamydiales bacterium]|nr:hypothetical protein [Candidatus Anoxychlamydiales bacterium]
MRCVNYRSVLGTSAYSLYKNSFFKMFQKINRFNNYKPFYAKLFRKTVCLSPSWQNVSAVKGKLYLSQKSFVPISMNSTFKSSLSNKTNHNLLSWSFLGLATSFFARKDEKLNNSTEDELTLNQLTMIAKEFGIKVDKTLSFQDLRNECFSAVYDNCKNGDTQKLRDTKKFKPSSFSNLKNQGEQTLADYALEQQNVELFENLLTIESAKDTCINALWDKCETSDGIKSIKQFGEKWKNEKNSISTLEDTKGNTLLERACERDKENIAKRLIDNKLYKVKNNQLHLTVQNGWHDLIEPLIIAGHDINSANKQGDTALHIVIRKKKINCLEELLKLGIDINQTTIFDLKNSSESIEVSALFLAIGLGSKKCFKKLLEEDIELQKTICIAPPTKEDSLIKSAKNCSGANLLHWAILNEQIDMLKLCLSPKYFERFKSIIKQTDSQGRSLVSIAAFKGKIDAIELLQQRGANLEVQDHKKMRAIHWAVVGGKKESIYCLFNNDCNLEEESREGSALQLAEKLKKAEIKNIIAGLIDRASKNMVKRYPDNLVFQGGGAKGILYVGVLRALENMHARKELKRVAGTSAGAITATLVALGFSSSKIREKLQNLDLKVFLDYHPDLKIQIENLNLFSSEGKKEFNEFIERLKEKVESKNKITYAILFFNAFKEYYSLKKTEKNAISEALNEEGLCKGVEFHKWIKKIIEERTGDPECTFGQLAEKRMKEPEKYKHLYVCASNIEEKEIKIFSSEDESTKHVRIADAVRASMSIPGVFTPFEIIDKNDKKFGTFVDGGILNNLPIEEFNHVKYKRTNEYTEKKEQKEEETNTRTWGFSFVSGQSSNVQDNAEQLKESSEKGIFKFLIDLGKFFYSAEETIMQPKNDPRIIKIPDQNIGTLDFDLDKEKQNNLINDTSNEISKNSFLTDWNRKKPINLPISNPVQIGQLAKDIQSLKEENEKAHEFLRIFSFANMEKYPNSFFEIWYVLYGNNKSVIEEIKNSLIRHKLLEINEEEDEFLIPNNSDIKVILLTEKDQDHKKIIQRYLGKFENIFESLTYSQQKNLSVLIDQTRIKVTKGSLSDMILDKITKILEIKKVNAEELDLKKELPFNIKTSFIAGQSYLDSKDYPNAKACYEDVIRSLTHSPELLPYYLINLGETKHQEILIEAMHSLAIAEMGLENYFEVVSILKRAIEISKGLAENDFLTKSLKLHRTLFRCYEEMGEYRKATLYSQLVSEIEEKLKNEIQILQEKLLSDPNSIEIEKKISEKQQLLNEKMEL